MVGDSSLGVGGCKDTAQGLEMPMGYESFNETQRFEALFKSILLINRTCANLSAQIALQTQRLDAVESDFAAPWADINELRDMRCPAPPTPELKVASIPSQCLFRREVSFSWKSRGRHGVAPACVHEKKQRHVYAIRSM